MKIKSPTFLHGLQRRLATTKRFEHRLDGVTVPEKGIGRAEWVISRALCRFARFDLIAVPRAQRTRALELQVHQWAPYPKAAFHVLWDEGTAQVWAWNADQVESAMKAGNVLPGRTSVVPETVLHKCPAQGATLATCMDGYEGQIWRGQGLAGSRWWPHIPGASEWINFQRDAGVSQDSLSTQVPAAVPAKLGDRPWGKTAGFGMRDLQEGSEQRVVQIAALCLLVPTLWYGAQFAKVSLALGERTSEVEELKRRAEPVMTARGQALEAMNRITMLQSAMDRFPDQATLMAKVAEILPKDGATLNEWDFANGKLKLRIASTSRASSSDFVKMFQSAGMFTNVEATPSNDASTLVLGMEVLRQSEIRPAADNSRPSR
jgi:hypothetical protein